VVDDGGVLLHLDTKFYYSLNGPGLAVWSLLEGGEADPAAPLSARWNAPSLRAEVEAFLAELARESLVVEGDGAPGGGAPLLDGVREWNAPRLIRHDVPLNQILSNPFDPSVPLAE
jgi:hypothetical protein